MNPHAHRTLIGAGALRNTLIWLSVGATVVMVGLALGLPSTTPPLVAIGVVVGSLGVFGLSAFVLVGLYQRQATSFGFTLGAGCALAGAHAWPLVDSNAPSESGVYALVLLACTMVFWAVLFWRMVLSDSALSLFAWLGAGLVWGMGIASLAVGGPGNLLLILLAEGDSGQIWLLNTLLTGMMCIVPVGPVTFLGWFGWRLVREFRRVGPA